MLKNQVRIVLAVLASIASLTVLRSLAQDHVHEQGARIALRIFQDGAAIDGLREQDVGLLVDGAPHAVSNWRNVKKMIGAPAAESRRLFVLVFHLNEYPASMNQAFDKLFRELLRDNDRILVLTNQATLLVENLADRDKSKADVEAFVREQARRFQQALDSERKNLTRLIERITSDYVRITANVHRHYYMKSFNLSLDEYLTFLRDYKQRYLLPNPGLFSGLCPQLAENPGEKWIIAFWQISEIPKLPRKCKETVARIVSDFQESTWLDENDYGARIKRWLIDVEDVFSGKSAFPAPDIYNLLAGFEATFHAFYVSPGAASATEDPEFKHVAEQCREILAGLALNSGGLFRAFAEPENDMGAMAGKVDSYYVLNFLPVSGFKKIGIHLPEKKMSVWFDPLGVAERAKECLAKNDMLEKQIELRDVSLQNRRLAFKIIHFLQEAAGKESKSRIFARVFLKDGQGRKVFNQSRNFEPQKNEIAVLLDLPPGVPAGRYDIEIEVGDWQTGKTHIRVLSAQLQ